MDTYLGLLLTPAQYALTISNTPYDRPPAHPGVLRQAANVARVPAETAVRVHTEALRVFLRSSQC